MELKVYFDDMESTLEITKGDKKETVILNDTEMVDLIEIGIPYEYTGAKW